ncbi:MAG: cell division protein FtsL [Candidatus Zixiibacteriota bacterium]|nr:MAG: cell division protein FtsL [candidate division Zixibacteria bacterium]
MRRFKETVEIRSSLLKRLRSHRYFPLATVAALVVIIGCLHIWQRVVVIELAKDVAGLRAQNRRLVDGVKKIHSEVTALSSASRIEKYAADSLGMHTPSADRLITLIPKSEEEIPADELQAMFSSIKRVADYLPVVTEAQASSDELNAIKFDTSGAVQ